VRISNDLLALAALAALAAACTSGDDNLGSQSGGDASADGSGGAYAGGSTDGSASSEGNAGVSSGAGDSASAPSDAYESDVLITAPPGDAGLCSSVSIIDPGSSTQPSGPGSQGIPECICTRRDATFPYTCPQGMGETNALTIGPLGGSISLFGQQESISGLPLTLTIPPGALMYPTVVTVTELPTPPPDGFVDWSPLYRIDPVDVVLAKPALIQIPVSNGAGSETYDQNLAVFGSGASTCALQALPDNFDSDGVFNNAALSRFGYVIVGYAHAGTVPACGASAEDAGPEGDDAGDAGAVQASGDDGSAAPEGGDAAAAADASLEGGNGQDTGAGEASGDDGFAMPESGDAAVDASADGSAAPDGDASGE
jgi:hypothetical protein